MSQPDKTGQLPCIVQLGFAGSRKLFSLSAEEEGSREALEEQVGAYLQEQLRELPGKLKLGAQHRLCGISQLAIGADTLFTRACREQGIPQRIFLPQPLDSYLSATGSTGAPDFTERQREAAIELLKSEHIIQERVVSDAPDRHLRFEDTNREILRVSDVVVCVVQQGAAGKRGGTLDLLDLACARNVPALEIRVALRDGKAVCEPHWHGLGEFKAPELPEEFAGLPSPQESAPVVSSEEAGKALEAREPVRMELPSVAEFCKVVKDHFSKEAAAHSRFFSRAARTIIGTHGLATLCATIALALHGSHPPAAPHPAPAVSVSATRVAAPKGHPVEQPDSEGHASPSPEGETHSAATSSEPHPEEPQHAGSGFPWIFLLLGVELILLAIGYKAHEDLHRRGASSRWAVCRLLAEINRSVRALGTQHLYLDYLFRLRLPDRLRPLLRTLNVLHLRSTRPHRGDSWETLRSEYLGRRLTHADWRVGQIQYYDHYLQQDKKWLSLARFTFAVCSGLAMGATLVKLAVVIFAPEAPGLITNSLGALAIFLPVLAVGALSLAAARDLEARVHVYSEMLKFLRKQVKRLERASSAREFEDLVEQTETQLLGEAAEWYSRRSYLSVN